MFKPICSLFVIFFLYGANTLTVSKSGKYQSISNALLSANAFDTIRVEHGTYTESLLKIRKPIVLIGINHPIIDGNDENEILIIMSDSVTVDGFKFINVGKSFLKDNAAIRVKRKKAFKIQNNIILNSFFGIYLEYAHDGVIENNRIIGDAIKEATSGNAIHLWYAQRVIIKNNYLERHRDGIYFEFADNCSVINNVSKNNLRYGLHFMFSHHDDYSNNTFEHNGAGVAVMFSKHVRMTNNRFFNNWGSASYGLLLKEIYDAEIVGNEFYINTIGIRIEGTNRILYKNNTFTQNGWAIKMAGGCFENRFIQNNFVANTFEFSTTSKFNNNVISSNYWSEYTGYDLDKNGVGDIPFHPIKLYSFVVSKTPETIVLLRSFFVDILNFAEKVSPIFTPIEVIDPSPQMEKIIW